EKLVPVHCSPFGGGWSVKYMVMMMPKNRLISGTVFPHSGLHDAKSTAMRLLRATGERLPRLKLLIDEHYPTSVAEQLRRRGHDAVAVQEAAANDSLGRPEQ